MCFEALKLNPFGKKVNDTQNTEQSETIEYNKKAHKKLKTDKFNKLRKEIIEKFLEDINQIFPDNDRLL